MFSEMLDDSMCEAPFEAGRTTAKMIRDGVHIAVRAPSSADPHAGCPRSEPRLRPVDRTHMRSAFCAGIRLRQPALLDGLVVHHPSGIGIVDTSLDGFDLPSVQLDVLVGVTRTVYSSLIRIA